MSHCSGHSGISCMKTLDTKQCNTFGILQNKLSRKSKSLKYDFRFKKIN